MTATLFSAETSNSLDRRFAATDESEPGASMPPAWSASAAFPANGPQTTSTTSQAARTNQRTL